MTTDMRTTNDMDRSMADACRAGSMTEDEVYDLADAISLVLDEDYNRFWTPSEMGRRVKATTWNTGVVLDWMLAERYVRTNGRGGSWVRYGARP